MAYPKGLIAGGPHRALAAVFAFLLFLAAPQPAEAQDFSFSSIAIEGNARVESATIVALADLPRGQPVSAAEVAEAQSAVQASGFFQTVEFVPQGSRLLIRVVERPTINRINVEGNRAIDDEVLLGLLSSQPRRFYSPQAAEADAIAIQSAYAEAGRFAASVRPAIIRRANNRVDLVFEVTEGRVIEIERVGFVGNRAYSDRRLRRVVESKQAGALRTLIRRDTFVAGRIDVDRQLLRDFYTSRGYADFQVVDVTSEFSRERGATFVTFTISEGQRFRFGEITASTDLPEVDTAKFSRAIRLRPGRVYSPVAVDNEIARLERLALREGLDFVRVDPVIGRNPRDGTLDVEFRIVRGPRIFVQRIDIEGNETTLDRVIRRQFDTVEGDPFNPRAIRESADRIRALGFFETVDVSSRPGSAEDQTIVDVDVVEQPTGTLSFGASYSSDTGPGFIAGFSESNFLGRGQALSADVSIGTGDQNTQVTFTEPFFLDRNLSVSFSVFYRTTDFDDQSYTTTELGFRTSATFPITEATRLTLSYLLAQDQLSGTSPATSAIILAEDRDVITSEIGYQFSFDSRRIGLDPDRFYRVSFGQDVAGLGGEAQYIRTEVTGVAERQVFQGDVTLRARGQAGAVFSFGDYVTRANDRYFNNSRKIRGFSPRGIGPRDFEADDEDALGGNYEAFASLEAEFPLGLPEEYGISGGLFADFGSVWGLDETCVGCVTPVDDGFELRSAVGVAVLWDTPIGPLRFNFAVPLNEVDGDETRNFNFDIQARF
ncbi:MAG: outer membrane protein assembly factor BamA [Paracoccaceae bacterium]|nr:outer membrane protein assembly factor BamA [Paracoccaceae bacterium]